MIWDFDYDYGGYYAKPNVIEQVIMEKERKKPKEKMIPISVIEDIKAEIEALPKTYPFVNHFDMYVKEDDVRKIIDKHISGKENK